MKDEMNKLPSNDVESSALVSNPKMSGFETTISCPYCDYDYLVEPEETQIVCNNPECGKTFKIHRVANVTGDSEPKPEKETDR